MFLARRIGWAGIALTFLTAGISMPGLLRSAAGSDSNPEGVAAIHQNETRAMQETLRDKGHYRGKVDGVFGLRTRASIRAYQKAENLPVTGQLDIRTAAKLGVGPEKHEKTVDETKGKPSAGLKWAKGSRRTSKPPQKAVKTIATRAGGHVDGEKTLQADADGHPHQ